MNNDDLAFWDGIANAIGIGALLCYLRTHGRVRNSDQGWQITAEGRRWLEALIEEAGEAPIDDKARTRVAQKARARAADPEQLPPVRKGNGHAPVIHGVAIEAGIPLPTRVLASKYRDIAAAMTVGTSVLLPNESAAGQLRKELARAGGKGASRQAQGGYRTWRVA
jgi:hypothetical protein